jgi:hypothetical protein
VLSLESGRWMLLETHEGHVGVRAPPFDAIELDLGALWIRAENEKSSAGS